MPLRHSWDSSLGLQLLQMGLQLPTGWQVLDQGRAPSSLLVGSGSILSNSCLGRLLLPALGHPITLFNTLSLNAQSSLSLVQWSLGILRKSWAALGHGPREGLPAGTAVLGWAGPLLPETTICRGSTGCRPVGFRTCVGPGMFSGHRAKGEVIEMMSLELRQTPFPICFEQSESLKWRMGVTLESQSVLREPRGLARRTKTASHIYLGEKETQALSRKWEHSALPTALVGGLPL